VPLRNYFGWLLTTFLVYLGAGLIWRNTKPSASSTAQIEPGSPDATISQVFAALPIIVYAEFALRYVTAGRIQALHVVALFAMGLPALLALIEVCLAKKTPETAG
jgi:uncharacterized membrane protein